MNNGHVTHGGKTGAPVAVRGGERDRGQTDLNRWDDRELDRRITHAQGLSKATRMYTCVMLMHFQLPPSLFDLPNLGSSADAAGRGRSLAGQHG